MLVLDLAEIEEKAHYSIILSDIYEIRDRKEAKVLKKNDENFIKRNSHFLSNSMKIKISLTKPEDKEI